MPGRNGKGPMGMGPRSGRRAGNCRGRGISAAASTNIGSRWMDDPELNRRSALFGPCRTGGGRGWRNMFRATGLPRWLRGGDASHRNPNQVSVDEKELLTNQLEVLQTELESVRQRLVEVEQEAKE